MLVSPGIVIHQALVIPIDNDLIWPKHMQLLKPYMSHSFLTCKAKSTHIPIKIYSIIRNKESNSKSLICACESLYSKISFVTPHVPTIVQ